MSQKFILVVSEGAETLQLSKQELLGAIARGWQAEANRHKEMDSALATAIFEELCAAFKSADDKVQIVVRGNNAQLGYATTAQLIDELRARAVTGGYADYATVNS